MMVACMQCHKCADFMEITKLFIIVQRLTIQVSVKNMDEFDHPHNTSKRLTGACFTL